MIVYHPSLFSILLVHLEDGFGVGGSRAVEKQVDLCRYKRITKTQIFSTVDQCSIINTMSFLPRL